MQDHIENLTEADMRDDLDVLQDKTCIAHLWMDRLDTCVNKCEGSTKIKSSQLYDILLSVTINGTPKDAWCYTSTGNIKM